MRTIRVSMVVALLVLTAIAPAVAQAQVDGTTWSGGSVAERVAGWLEGLWRAVARSESGPTGGELPADLPAVVPEAPPMEMTEGDPTTQGEVYPERDPNG